MTIIVRSLEIDRISLTVSIRSCGLNPASGLVQQQKPWRGRERELDLEPAFLAIGKLGNGRVGSLYQIDQFERPLNPFFEAGDPSTVRPLNNWLT